MAAPTVTREFGSRPATRNSITVLDEVIYRMDVDGEIPQAAEVRREHSGLRLTLAMTDTTGATLIGAVPKAVSLHELCFGKESGAWRCTVTIDV